MILNTDIIFTKITNDNIELETRNIPEKYNSTQRKTICICSNSEPIEGISTYVEKIKHKLKSLKPR